MSNSINGLTFEFPGGGGGDSFVADCAKKYTPYKPFFSNANLSAYGKCGIIIPCRNGDTIYLRDMLGLALHLLVGTPLENAVILSAIPEGYYGSITAITLGTFTVPQAVVDERNRYAEWSYTVNNSACQAVFVPMETIKPDNVATIMAKYSNYFSEIRYAQAVSPQIVPPQYFNRDFQKDNLLFNVDSKKAMYASLFGAVSDMVGAKVAVLGDSLTEQSAGYWSSPTDAYNFKVGNASGDGWYSRIARKYMQTYRTHGAGQQWWYSTSARPAGGTTAVDRLVSSGYVPDYIILEYGTNDILSGNFGTAEDVASAEATTTVGAVKYCLETLQSNFPSARIIVILPYLHTGTNHSAPARQATYKELILPIIQSYAVRVVDMDTESGITYAMGNTDGIHLATVAQGDGYDNTTEAVARYSRCLEAAMLDA